MASVTFGRKRLVRIQTDSADCQRAEVLCDVHRRSFVSYRKQADLGDGGGGVRMSCFMSCWTLDFLVRGNLKVFVFWPVHSASEMWACLFWLAG